MNERRKGRVVREEQEVRAARNRAAQLMRSGGGGGGSFVKTWGRPSQGFTTGSRGRSTETVLKVINWSKTRHSARNQAAYITRNRENDQPEQAVPMETANGKALTTKEEIAAEIESWNLTPAAQNHSKVWKSATPEERAQMATKDALDKRQSAHLIFSIPATGKSDAETLQSAVRDGLAKTLGEGGYRYAFAVHTDHSERPHAHIIVKAQSEPRVAGERSRQLRLNEPDLFAIRTALTQECQAQGLSVTATRRVDRFQTREAIAQGKEPMRDNKTRGQLWAERQSTQGRRFASQAANWYAEYGLAYEQRRMALLERSQFDMSAESAQQEPTKQQTPRRSILGRLRSTFTARRAEQPKAATLPPTKKPPAIERLDRFFAATTTDAGAARKSFVKMYAEAPRLAVWAANNHVQAFGVPTGKRPPFAVTGRGLKAAVAEIQTVSAEANKPADPAQRTQARQLAQDVAEARAKVERERRPGEVHAALKRTADQLVRVNDSEAQRGANMARKLTDPKAQAEAAKAARLAELNAQARKRARLRGKQQSRGRGQSQDQ